MPTAAWQTKITCGGETGSGFLVSDREVLTCAHVVTRDRRAQVLFAGRPDLDPVGATVVERGGWTGKVDDPGDVAVLLLDTAVPIEPARFAELGEAYAHPAPKLLGYGFPRGYDSGTLAEFRAAAGQLIAGEWVQLEAWTPTGQPLTRGFSGAAAAVEGSGRVVGMVSAASKSPEVRTGRMIPAHVLARHWPPAADLIPTPRFGPESKRLLRTVLVGLGKAARPEELEAMYAEAVGPLGPAHPSWEFDSYWDLAWYLMSEVVAAPGGCPVSSFVETLAARTEDPVAQLDLRRWLRRHQPTPGAPPAGSQDRPRWSPILVEIDRSGSGPGSFMVEISAFRDGHRHLVGTRTLPKARIRDFVVSHIDAAFHELDHHGSALIAFAVPREWLNQPLDEWHRAKDDSTPLGCFSPVVLMDIDRRRSGALQFKLHQKWESLDRLSTSVVQRIDCGTTHAADRLTVRLGSTHHPVGFGRPPKLAETRRLLAASLNAAVPIVVWPRTGCTGVHGPGTADGCAGRSFLDRLSEQLASVSPAELPEYVHALRRDAFVHDGEPAHWARGLTLLWEDPRCFPEPGGYRLSPVDQEHWRGPA
ncbi:trypsin-like peptidase domain-containing protein [Kitasatospora sp. NPDC057512]|uniref:VMAP-C domain-containing protein n=1 Tax=Kitasatospora sp. NPDC057512 TaxID=3346154 RepID=UPI0036C15CAE